MINIIKNDLKNLSKDPILFFMLFLPIITASVYVWLLPILNNLLIQYLNFDLTLYMGIIYTLFSLMPAYFYGFVFGFVIIGEKDQHLLDVFLVTPCGMNDIFKQRGVFVVLLSLIANSIFLLMTMNFSIQNIITVFTAAITAPCFALMLGILASNKVEAMAIGKLTALVLLTPLASYFDISILKVIAVITPSYWQGLTLQSTVVQNILMYSIVSIAVSLAWIYVFLKIFKKKAILA